MANPKKLKEKMKKKLDFSTDICLFGFQCTENGDFIEAAPF